MNQKIILFTLAMNVILVLQGHFATAADKNSRSSVNPPSNMSGRTSIEAITANSGTTPTIKVLTHPTRIDSSVFEEAAEIERSCESRYEEDECAILYCECLEEAGLDPDDPELHFRPTRHGDNCGTSHLAEELADLIGVAWGCQDERDECEEEQRY